VYHAIPSYSSSSIYGCWDKPLSGYLNFTHGSAIARTPYAFAISIFILFFTGNASASKPLEIEIEGGGKEAEVTVYIVYRSGGGGGKTLNSPYVKHTGRTKDRFLTQGVQESTSNVSKKAEGRVRTRLGLSSFLYGQLEGFSKHGCINKTHKKELEALYKIDFLSCIKNQHVTCNNKTCRRSIEL